jgi:hypothetical protein
MKPPVLLSLLATVCSAALFIVIAFWLPSTLLKARDYAIDTGAGLTELKQSCELLTKTVASSQEMATSCVRLAVVICMVLLAINIILFVLMLVRYKRLAS